MNFKKIVTKGFFILLLLVISFQITAPARVSAVTQSDIEKKQKEIENLKKQIAEAEKRQKELQNSYKNEDAQQDALTSDAKKIEEILANQEKSIASVQSEVDKTELMYQSVTKEKELAETKLVDIEASVESVTQNLNVSLNLLIKMGTTASSFLDKSASFENAVLGEEKQKALARLVKSDLETLKVLKVQAEEEKNTIVAKSEEVKKLQEEKDAQLAALSNQKDALAWQKNNKLALVESSKEKQERLAAEEKAVDDKKDSISEDIHEKEGELYALIGQLTNQPAPPNAGYIQAGQVLGFQGRTGLVCGSLERGVTRTNNYCLKYAGVSGLYYHDPIAFPKKGSHLHFSYIDTAGRKNRTLEYLQAGSKEFKFKPLTNYRLTQGYHSGYAVDMVQDHGAPVYAVKSGRITYYCETRFPFVGFPDPAYGAIIRHDDGSSSVYWHLQRRANSPVCVKS